MTYRPMDILHAELAALQSEIDMMLTQYINDMQNDNIHVNGDEAMRKLSWLSKMKDISARLDFKLAFAVSAIKTRCGHDDDQRQLPIGRNHMKGAQD